MQLNLWTRLSSPYNFINISLFSEVHTNANQAFKKLGIESSGEPLSEKDIEKIYSDETAFVAINTYLNYFENICCAVNIGYIDQDCAYNMHSIGVLLSYIKFQSYIKYTREKLKNDEMYIEIEKVAHKWGEKYSRTIKN